MSRADTGALVNQWYRNILGPDGYLHEVTLGEVRHGDMEVVVVHPASGEEVSITDVRVTEVEAIEDLDEIGEARRWRISTSHAIATRVARNSSSRCCSPRTRSTRPASSST